MKTVPVTMCMPALDGYDYTGEYRKLQFGETGLIWGKPTDVDSREGTATTWPVLRRKVNWHPLSLETAARLLADDLPANFRFCHNNVQTGGKISTIRRVDGLVQVYVNGTGWWTLCNVEVDLVTLDATVKAP